jgi:hypothetical protein
MLASDKGGGAMGEGEEGERTAAFNCCTMVFFQQLCGGYARGRGRDRQDMARSQKKVFLRLGKKRTKRNKDCSRIGSHRGRWRKRRASVAARLVEDGCQVLVTFWGHCAPPYAHFYQHFTTAAEVGDVCVGTPVTAHLRKIRQCRTRRSEDSGRCRRRRRKGRGKSERCVQLLYHGFFTSKVWRM